MYSAGGYSSSSYSEGGSAGSSASPPLSGGTGVVADTVVLSFSCDADIAARSDFNNSAMQVSLGFECDAQLLVGTGGAANPTRPTGWIADTAITTIWVPERPVTGT